MLRYGKISKYNAVTGKGQIIDSNLQDISFEVSKLFSFLMVNDQVRFRIKLESGRLKAVSVKKNLSKIPNTISPVRSK